LWEETLLLHYMEPPEYREWELHFSFGINAVGVIPIVGNSGVVVGAIVDLLLGDSYNPVYLYGSVKVGWRQFFNRQFDLELDVEPGVFPFFEPLAIFGKVNLQAGFHL
jgi:hypothetical protein